MNEMERYFTALLDNRIPAGKRMKQAAEKILTGLVRPGKYHFDQNKADRHTDFIQTFCRVPAGKLGAPLRLEPFQLARMQAIFGFVDDDGYRQYNEVMIVEGRKNGKTTECAAVELDLCLNDDEGAPEIYNIATKMDQAKKGYRAADNMRLLSPDIARHLRRTAEGMNCDFNMGVIKAMASNTKSLDGLDSHCVIIDELAAIQNRDIYDLMKQSMGARKQPLLFCITTNGFVRDCIFDAQYTYACSLLDGTLSEPNEHFLPLIYELDDVSEWRNEEAWMKANPGLGTIKSWDFLRQMVSKAIDDPAYKPTVLVKDFNKKQTAETAWLRWEDFDSDKKFDPRIFGYCIGGMDAADSVDLNAATALMQRPGDQNIYRLSMYWLPESVIEEYEKAGNRRERDNEPYRLWADQGWLRLTEGNKVDKAVFLDWFRELRDDYGLIPSYIGYDPWHIDDSLLRDFRGEFGKDCMVPVRQGTFSLSAPMKDLKADIQAGRLIYQGNPIDKMCLHNAAEKRDVNGNTQLVKMLDKRKRIDGTAALLDAYKVLQDKRDQYIALNEPE